MLLVIWESCLWWFDWEYQIENDQAHVSHRPVWGKRGEGVVWFSVCGGPLDDWTNSGYVDVLFTCGESGFSFFRSWSCSEEQVWDWMITMLQCFQLKEMSTGWHSRNLILAIYCCRIAMFTTCLLWTNG